MRTALILVCLSLISFASAAQGLNNNSSQSNTNSSYSSGWMNYMDNLAHINFQLPVEALVIDSLETLHTILYSSEVDSLLGLQVHVFDSAYLSMDEELFAEAMEENDNDELRAIAQIFLVATNSDLLSLEEITNNMGQQGIEIGLDYQTLQSDYPAISFIRYFLIDHKFIAFSISGSEDDMLRLMSYKDIFFDSINFY